MQPKPVPVLVDHGQAPQPVREASFDDHFARSAFRGGVRDRRLAEHEARQLGVGGGLGRAARRRILVPVRGGGIEGAIQRGGRGGGKGEGRACERGGGGAP